MISAQPRSAFCREENRCTFPDHALGLSSDRKARAIFRSCRVPCANAAIEGRLAARFARRRNSLHARHPPSATAHPARLILILSLAPNIGLSIGRFAYALVLPDMRNSLGWSYSAAGFMNTINAAGYLAGALAASRLIRRFGLGAAVRGGTLASLASLSMCALSGNFIVLSVARLVIGFGAAAGFIAGGALAARIGQSRPERADFLLSLFYAGPGIGILA